MKKKLALVLAALLAVGSLAACGGNEEKATNVKVGLGLHTQMDYSSKDAGLDKDGNPANGLAQADLTVAGVTLNEDGTIASIKVDAIQVKTNFDSTGAITETTPTEFSTKRELGDNYNMKGTSASIGAIEGGAEWYEQADAFEGWAKGKTADQISKAISEDGKASDKDLLAGCTMKINGLVAATVKAINNAKAGNWTAASTDVLNIGIVAEVSGPTSATADKAGAATAYANFTAVTKNAEGKITACVLDSVQAKFAWDNTGKITSDLTVDTTTKYDLKEGYNMKGASAGKGVIEGGAEWYEQADAFMGFVKGKTADEVSKIAVDESGYPTDKDLTAGCTMKVTAYIACVGKALAK